VADVEGVTDWQADKSPFAQFCADVSCCVLLPEVPSDVGVCALAAVRDRATRKTINIRKHLLMLVLIFVVFRS
jgi:hypothetical protein